MKITLIRFFLFFNLITSISVFSQQNNGVKSFTLNGKIIGQNSGKIILKYWGCPNYVQDTVTINNGEFVFSGNIMEPTKAWLIGNIKSSSPTDDDFTYIYLEPGIMSIILSKDKFKEHTITGSKTQQEFDTLNQQTEPYEVSIETLKNKLWPVRNSIKKTNNEDSIKQLESCSAKIKEQINQFLDEMDHTKLKFILSHPKSYVSADLLWYITMNSELPLDSIKAIYTGMDTIIQNSMVGKSIRNNIAKKENNVAEVAPDFKALDINGQTVTLSEFRNKKVVLLDFWASWCAPCRHSMPHLKEVYKLYHSKGLEIISITRDSNKEDWLKAIKHDSISIWYHIPSSSKNFIQGASPDDEINRIYSLPPIPTIILIDKNGMIIGRWKGAGQETEIAIDKKLKDVFKQN